MHYLSSTTAAGLNTRPNAAVCQFQCGQILHLHCVLPLRGQHVQSVADCRAASAASVGVGSGTETQARDVFSLSDFTLKAQLCKWLTAYIQNAQYCSTKRRSPRHWVCATITCQQANATCTHGRTRAHTHSRPLGRGGNGKECNCRKENSEVQFET